VLGFKGLNYFLWCARHDTDEEFLRLYGARVQQMIDLHKDTPEAWEALDRLQKLANPILTLSPQ